MLPISMHVAGKRPQRGTVNATFPAATTVPRSLLWVANKASGAFTWPFVVADVRRAILGMNFLSAHDIFVYSRRQQFIHKPFNTRIQAVPSPGQAPVIPHLQTDSPITSLLKEFPLITTLQPQPVKMTQGVTHFIVTTGPALTAHGASILNDSGRRRKSFRGYWRTAW
ncbi:hypothetical protein O3P69_005286 [Scylla paramamosain]|uniref:Uncharacterized protein n=1 Tax=Scylla paramamosain TaxID=85552 RepID=A0AAW0U7K7_SCYPA